MIFQLLLRIQRNKHHIAFILSVVLSLSFIYFSPSPQYNHFRNSINSIVAVVLSPFSELSDLSTIKLENEILRQQLLLLSLEKESLLVNEMENTELKEMLDLKQNIEIDIVPAKVINIGLHTSITALTINVGSDNGVGINDAVITPYGVIGKVQFVSEKSSIVHLINDSEFRIGVRILPSGEIGVLRWKANNICEVREVYKNSEINIGDHVVTSGLSDIFPEGLFIGKVSSVTNTRDQFQKIVSVKYEENLNALTYVFVITEEIINK